LLALLSLVFLAQCTEREVAAPAANDVPRVAAPVAGIELLLCEGSTQARTVSCRPDLADGTQGAAAPAGVSANVSTGSGMVSGTRIVGNQGVHVQLTGSNFTLANDTFAFDVTVQNLVPQAMGTLDGVTLDPSGIKVFFHQLPTVVSGSGSVAVANEDGIGVFTASNQPYYQYDELLSSNEVSAAKAWKFEVTGTITFQFKVYLLVPLQFPAGYIDVVPASAFALAGNTDALSATVRQWDGTPAVEQGVSWGSTDAGIATVDGAGLVTAVAPGAVQITATKNTLAGSTTINVCPDLAVGQVYRATFPSASSICFGAGGSAQEYTYMPINHSVASALSLTLTGTGIQAVTGPPTPQVAEGAWRLSPAFGGRSEAVEEFDLGDYLHWQIQEENRRYAETAQRIRLADRAADADGQLIPAGVPTVGDLWNLNVAIGCSGARDERVGQVRSVSQHAIIVSDTTNPPGGFTTAQYDSIALEFDSLAYAVNAANFGAPTDLDTNGRAVIFYTRAVNELSPPASSVVVLGYFTARDLFSSGPDGCSRSNEGEMFYMLVPDPTGAVNSNVRTVSFVRGSTVGTTGHELQHLINASRRLYLVPTNNLEEVWLNEALSHVAEELIFYRASVGLTPGMNIITSNLTTGPNASRRVAAFNSYANPNFGRLRSWLQRPDTGGAFKDNDVLSNRGAAWAFMRYAADRNGGTQANFWSNLVNTSLTGTANLQAVTGASPTEWLSDFTAAMYGDDAVAGISAIFTQPSWSFRSLYTALNGSYQLVPRPLTNAVGLTLSYSRGGGTAYARFGVPASSFATITALSGGVPPISPVEVLVMRTK
jgi:hypothetical protein